MTDLREQLCALIDASAEPVRPAEAMGPRVRRTHAPSRRPRRPLAPALVGAAAVILAAVGIAAATRDEPTAKTAAGTTAASTAAADPTTCYPEPCRDVDDAEASALLGVPVAMPSGIPEGWELVDNEVDFYPAGIEVNGIAGADVDIVFLRRSWSPPGESYTEGCSPSVGIAVIPAGSGNEVPTDDFPTFMTLPDGTPVFGSVGPGVCGNPGGEEAESGGLFWWHAGVAYRVGSFGVPAESLRLIVTSLP
jgi:hypothetical protein